MLRRTTITLILLLLLTSLPSVAALQDDGLDDVYLAYVHQNTVMLADANGSPLQTTGPDFLLGESARLFWSPDGQSLYIARRDGLFQTTAGGGAAVRLPGTYSLTITLNRTGNVFYYLDSSSPVPLETDPNLVTFPLREMNTANLSSGMGRLAGYVGAYPTGTATAMLNGAALQYARDGGLLGPSRPRIFTTYGDTVFFSCCFPEPGLSAFSLQSGDTWTYPGTETLIPGSANLNHTLSRLAAPTAEGNLVVLDLITGGTRTYQLSVGTIERVGWSADDTKIYIAVRTPPNDPLALNTLVTTDIDTRSAVISVLSLDLVTAQTRQLATLGEFYGVSSMVVTEDYIFVVVVESNVDIVNALNSGQLPPDTSSNDPVLVTTYLPDSILYRITPDGREAFSILSDVWGIAARPLN